jgi:curved DNA-binding protein CbpA
MTFYAILGIPPTADDETIRTAYRSLARRYHPDVGKGSSPEKFREVVTAYETLSDPQRRHSYDLTLGSIHPHSVPIEPLAQSEPFRVPRHVFASEPVVFSRSVHLNSYLDAVFDEFLASFDDDILLFRSRWPW